MKILRYKSIFMIGLVVVGLALSRLILSRRERGVEGLERSLGESEEKVAVRLFEVKRKQFSDCLDAMGTIKGNNEIELRFSNTGYLSGINFKEGDWIEKGEVIAELDLREAELRLEKARIEFENTQKLYKLGAVLKERYEEAMLNLRLAEEERRRHLLFSPFKGILGKIEKEAGELVTPQDKIANFIEASSVYVDIGIIEKEIRKIREGQIADVKVDTYPEKLFQGKVATIVPVVTGTNRTMRVRVRLGNPGGELLPGMFARVKIFIYDKSNALLIPSSSLFSEGNKFFVFKVVEQRLSRSEVVVNYLNEEYAEVRDGVREGDTVAIKVMGTMGDGKNVEIID